MGRLELYGYDAERGFCECNTVTCERGYGLGGGMSYIHKIWIDLEKMYLPPYDFWDGQIISRMSTAKESEWQKVWDLIIDERLEEFEKMLLLSTFDIGFIRYESIDKFCNAIREYQRKYGSNETFETVIKALEYEKKQNCSKYFGLFDSVSSIGHIEIDTEEESENEILELLNSNKDFKADKEGGCIFLDLDKLYEKYPEEYFI